MKTEIIETLDRWNFWNRSIDTGVKRKFYLNKILPLLKMPEIIAITGVRRSGKSTIILQIIKDLIKRKVNSVNTLYINFEEPRLENFLSALGLDQIYEFYLEFFNPKGKIYLFLDEVQMVKNWEKFVASLYDRRQNVKIVVSGSSAKLLKGEISALLSGRYLSEIVYPLSFVEFLDFKKISYKGIKNPKFLHFLREYIKFGGFPRVVLEKNKGNKEKILTEYFNIILEKDVILRHNIKNIKNIKELSLFVLTNISNQISTYKIEKMLGISSQNVKRYFNYFAEAFLLQFSSFFSYSVKKQIYNPQKVFAIDSGLRNAVSFKFSEDAGRLLENVVYNKLKTKYKEVFFWKNAVEVDFLVREGYKVKNLYNVCYSIREKIAWEREKKSLLKAKLEFPDAKAKLIYWRRGKEEQNSDFELIHILDFLIQ